jgi:hypothetical protein
MGNLFARIARKVEDEFKPRDYPADIAYLKALVPLQFRQLVEQKCVENLARYGPSLRSKYHSLDREHKYGPQFTQICKQRREDAVFALMKSNGFYTAPTDDRTAIFTGKVEELITGDFIVRLVDEIESAVWNVTLPTHILFPGYVKLQVTSSISGTDVSVFGAGKGNLASANMVVGRFLFRSLLELGSEELPPEKSASQTR